MLKICPLFKAALLFEYGDGAGVSEFIHDLVVCDRNNCEMWIPSEIDPGKYGHCGLKRWAIFLP